MTNLSVWFQLHSTLMLANEVSTGKNSLGIPFPVGSAEAAKQALRQALAVSEGTDYDHLLIQIIAAAIFRDLDKIIIKERQQ